MHRSIMEASLGFCSCQDSDLRLGHKDAGDELRKAGRDCDSWSCGSRR